MDFYIIGFLNIHITITIKTGQYFAGDMNGKDTDIPLPTY